jgi:hypothetical protein
MTYAMVLIKTDAEWEALSKEEMEFDALVRWWAELRQKGVILAGAQLGPPRTATTISWKEQQPIVTDGPHLEAKETIGGIAILNVDSQEEAIEIAKAWPSRRAIRIEVRPIVNP